MLVACNVLSSRPSKDYSMKFGDLISSSSWCQKWSNTRFSELLHIFHECNSENIDFFQGQDILFQVEMQVGFKFLGFSFSHVSLPWGSCLGCSSRDALKAMPHLVVVWW
jgi:hypothetical protein